MMTTNHYFLLGSDLGSNPRPYILGSDRLDKCITKDWSKMTGKFEIFTVKECLLQNFQVFFESKLNYKFLQQQNSSTANLQGLRIEMVFWRVPVTQPLDILTFSDLHNICWNFTNWSKNLGEKKNFFSFFFSKNPFFGWNMDEK